MRHQRMVWLEGVWNELARVLRERTARTAKTQSRSGAQTSPLEMQHRP